MVHLGLTGGVGDLAVVKNNGVTSSTLIEVPANALGELGVRVGKEELLSLSLAPGIYTRYTGIETHNVVVLDVVGLAPGAHDESIVVGQDSNDIDTLLADLRELLEVFGDVVGGANRGEGTGQREEDDLLVGPLLGRVVVDGDTARGDLRLLLGPGDVPGFC